MEKYLDKNSVLRLLQGIKTQIDKSKKSVIDTKGVANGIASLDENGNVPLSQLGNVDTDIHEIAIELPTQLTEKQSKHIFLVPRGVDEKTNKNIYKEYIFTGSDITNVKDTDWEQLGEFTTSVDLKDYSKKSDTISDISFTDMGVDGSFNPNVKLNNLLCEFADGKRKLIVIPLASGPLDGDAHKLPGCPGFMSGEDKEKLDKIDINALTASINAANTAANNTNKAIQAAENATLGAEKVDATLTEENVFEVTGRTGVKKTLDISGLVSAQSDVTRIKESMGAYSARPDITLVTKETNKAISADGVKVTKAGWAIAEFTAEKGNIYLFKPNEVDSDVCIFAEEITNIETRGIDYTYTYNAYGNIETAKATYLGETHTYTFTYAEDKSYTIIDESGETVKALPMTYETKVGSYSPLLRLNADAELPIDGYCRYMSHFKGNSSIKIVVSYKIDAADLVMNVVRDGVFASISTQLGNLSKKEDETRKKMEDLHGSWVDVKYSKVGDNYFMKVDNTNIIPQAMQKIRIYPKYNLSWGIQNAWVDISARKILFDVSRLDTSKFTDMSNMFSDCSSLTTIDVSRFDTSKVTNMSSMFSNCSSLTTIDVSGFDTSKVTNMSSMFYNCSSLTTIDVSGFDTSKVTNMSSMFFNCSSLTTIDVSGFDTSKVTDMSSMFSNCSSLTTIDVSGFDTSKVTNMSSMFSRCLSLKKIVADIDTSALENATNMFGDTFSGSSITSILLGTNFFKMPLTNFSFYHNSSWKDDTVKQSLVTNSYDRKSNGLPDLTLNLNNNTKKVLTEGDIATMTAKGYIIA